MISQRTINAAHETVMSVHSTRGELTEGQAAVLHRVKLTELERRALEREVKLTDAQAGALDRMIATVAYNYVLVPPRDFPMPRHLLDEESDPDTDDAPEMAPKTHPGPYEAILLRGMGDA